MTLAPLLRRLRAALRRRVIAAAIRSILTDTTGKHQRRVYIRKGTWMVEHRRARRTGNPLWPTYRTRHLKHRAAKPPKTGRAATAGTGSPPPVPADLSRADLARGTLGSGWIADQITRADQIARQGQTP